MFEHFFIDTISQLESARIFFTGQNKSSVRDTDVAVISTNSEISNKNLSSVNTGFQIVCVTQAPFIWRKVVPGKRVPFYPSYPGRAKFFYV